MHSYTHCSCGFLALQNISNLTIDWWIVGPICQSSLSIVGPLNVVQGTNSSILLVPWKNLIVWFESSILDVTDTSHWFHTKRQWGNNHNSPVYGPGITILWTWYSRLNQYYSNDYVAVILLIRQEQGGSSVCTTYKHWHYTYRHNKVYNMV
mgnify:CR=1 FL=1